MLKSQHLVSLLSLVCFGAAHVGAALVSAGEPSPSSLAERRVELFTAAANGEIDIELTAPSAREVYLRVTNKTDEQLRIALPDAFAAVPVLAQFAPGGNFGGGNGMGLMGGGNNFGGGGNFGNFAGGNGQGNMGGGGQGLGGGFNNLGNAGGNNGIGNMMGNGAGIGNQFGGGQFRPGMFRVPAGRVGKVRATTVCLEHGKPEPNSRMQYHIVPLGDFNSDPRIARICQLLAGGQISQNVAQAAAWHVADGLSWEALAAQERVRSKYTGSQKFFTGEELELAVQVVDAIETNAAATTAATTRLTNTLAK